MTIFRILTHRGYTFHDHFSCAHSSKEKRQDPARTLRKTAAMLRAELMDEKKVDAFFPSVAEAKVPEDEPPAVTQ